MVDCGEKLLTAKLAKKPRKERTPAKTKAPAVSDLPAEMQQLLERYKREHPGKVQPIAYIIAGGPDAARSVSQFADLPPEDELVILALTETVASADRVEAGLDDLDFATA